MSIKPVAIVTGASRGIGRGIALELARTHTVIGTYRGRRDAAESLQAECGADILQCDIGSPADRAALIAYAVDKYGRIDLLVNNAGIAPRERKDILEASEEIFDEVLDTNLKGPYFLTQLAARQMITQGSGRVVFVTSISAYTASIMRGEYCVSKAGLSMAVQLWAARLAPHNVQVFEVRPGIIRTDMIEKVKDAYEEKAKNGLLPQNRLGDPADVAKPIRAIADGLIDYGTGTVINADGGFHLRIL
ncbi:3-ketoacyl-ACP reductase [Paludibaculum fermentans]|uniref:3-ketoacyl-ACP reductase n=1 Tax=Paludibaculum fermentans TaxID=1473598 RepID=A0A7S7NNG4_PALFE|nr:3-ketoacyl-ACP reductase [Paludibaculum fermentans]QOY86840.1 3-ketoacyl-ACP reductase [Paludibaculum fermentans]